MRSTQIFSLKSFRFFLAVFLGVTIGVLNAEANPLPVTVSPTIQKALKKIISPKNANDPTVGTLKGNFQVSPQGTASYSIPIAVPPGTADMAPLLSISYSSSGSNLPASNGLLGTGFSLQGLTAITRCPSNLAKNGHIHGIDYTDQDLFCFDGEQLVAIKGAYGADGTEYRTYVDNRSKIISYGKQGNGPASFRVWTKGGQVAEYAFTPDSQVKAEGKDTVATWALNKITDATGNYLTVSYFKDESKGEYYPNRIDYTGNDKAGLKPYNSVRFFYENRPDPRNWYKAGSKEILDQRMNEIKVYSGETVVYDYKFSYEISKNTYRSRLTSMQECDGSGICLKPMTFAWQTNEEGWEPATSSYYPPKPIVISDVLVSMRFPSLDNGVRFVSLTGNGLTDMLWGQNLPDYSCGYWFNNGSGWTGKERVPGEFCIPRGFVNTSDGKLINGKDFGTRLIDLDGDGLPDVLWGENLPDYTCGAWFNTGTTWEGGSRKPGGFCVPKGFVQGDGQDYGTRLADLRGTGLPDLLWGRDVANEGGVWFNTKNGWTDSRSESDLWYLPRGFVDPKEDYNSGKDFGTRLVDLNGDGLPDLIHAAGPEQDGTAWANDAWFNDNGKKWIEQRNYKMPVTIVQGKDGADNGVRFEDMNGDGLSDIVWGRDLPGQGGYWINTGSSWKDSRSESNLWYLPKGFVDPKGYNSGKDFGTRLIDLNGDGLPDLIHAAGPEQDATPVANDVWFNDNGRQWVEKTAYKMPVNIVFSSNVLPPIGGGGQDNGVRFVDLTGSGFEDIIFNNGRDKGAWLNKAKKLPDYLIGVTDGYNGQLKIDYESLSNPKVNVCTKEHDAKYPNMDWQGPMYVVYQTASDMGVTDAKTKKQVLAKNVQNFFGNDPLLHVTTYHYTGAKFNHLGYGFLGFHQVTTKDESTGINVTTTYSQDYNQHTVGQVLSSETRLSNGALRTLIASTQNTWDLKTFGSGAGTYFVPYTKNITNKTFDFDGNLISTKTTDITVDNYTNPTQIISTIQDTTGTYRTTTNNTYENDTDQWLIGELHATTVTADAPNKPSITRKSIFDYDDRGLLLDTVVSPDDARYMVMTTYGRDSFGNIGKTIVSAKGGITDRITISTYDPTGRFVVQSTDPLKHSTTQTYDERFGKVLTATDHNNLTVTNHYDNFGRLIQTDYPDGTQQLVEYNWCNGPNGAVYTVTTHKSGSPTHVEYFDQSNRRVAETTEGMKNQAIMLIWNMTYYDDLGRVVQKTLPYFAGDQVYSVRFTYDDPLGRVTKTTHPDGSVTKVQYKGLTVITTNDAEQKQIKISNARDNLIQVIDNLGNKTSYDYDVFGNLIQVTDSAGNISTMKYDDYGHRIEMNDVDKGHWTYQYDPLGQLISQTDAMKQTTSFQYDLLGRMTSRTDPAGTSTWEYGTVTPAIDKLVKVTGVANANGGSASGNDLVRAAKDNLVNYERTYEYDKPLGRLITTTTNINGQNYTTRTSYDGFSRPEIEIYPNSDLIVKNTYNSIGYLAEVDNLQTGQMYWKLNEMDAANHVTSEINSNGIITNYTYNNATGFLTDIVTVLSQALEAQKRLFPWQTAIPANPSLGYAKNKVNKINELQNQVQKMEQEIQNLHYSYDTIGNMTERKDNANGVTEDFTFDELNRLKQNSIVGGNTTDYRYDSLGNIIYKSDVGIYHYPDSGTSRPHAVTSVTDGPKNATFEYNDNGDQTRGVINGVERTISYTSYSKPKEIKQGNATSDFYYNADRDSFMRVDKVDGKTTTTLYLGNYELVSIDDGTKVTVDQKYYVGNNTLCIKTSDGKESHENTYVLLKDNLGSITDIVDQNANIVQHFTYTPFGEQKQTKGEIPSDPITHHGFTGHEQVEPFNLVHMGGRIYDPMLGRFLTADPTIQAPANPQDLNRYSYCLNNPLRFTDPNGFGWFDWVSDIIKAVCDVVKDIVDAVCDLAKELLSNRYVVMAMEIIAGATTGGLAYVIVPAISALSAVACGGSFGDALHAAAMTLVTMELSGLSNAISKCACSNLGCTGFLGKGAITGVVRGSMNLAEGKSFKDGFLSGAVEGATADMVTGINKGSLDQISIMERTAASGIIGGTEATVTGGEFIDGAETAAFSRLFGDEAQAQRTQNAGKFSNANELKKSMQPNTMVIGERPLDLFKYVGLSGFMYSDPLLHALGLDLAHESVFYINSDKGLTSRYYGPDGVELNTELGDNRINSYEFGADQVMNSSVPADGKYMSGFGPPIYTVWPISCQSDTRGFVWAQGGTY